MSYSKRTHKPLQLWHRDRMRLTRKALCEYGGPERAPKKRFNTSTYDKMRVQWLNRKKIILQMGLPVKTTQEVQENRGASLSLYF